MSKTTKLPDLHRQTVRTKSRSATDTNKYLVQMIQSRDELLQDREAQIKALEAKLQERDRLLHQQMWLVTEQKKEIAELQVKLLLPSL